MCILWCRHATCMQMEVRWVTQIHLDTPAWQQKHSLLTPVPASPGGPGFPASPCSPCGWKNVSVWTDNPSRWNILCSYLSYLLADHWRSPSLEESRFKGLQLFKQNFSDLREIILFFGLLQKRQTIEKFEMRVSHRFQLFALHAPRRVPQRLLPSRPRIPSGPHHRGDLEGPAAGDKRISSHIQG